MANTFSAYLGAAGLTDVGYAFYDSSETIIGSRTTSGVVDAGSGWYSVSATAGATAVSIRWNSTGTPTAIAREYFNSSPTSGYGAYVVTVTVRTSGAVAIQNATVRLTQGVNSYTAITNVSGVATFSLDAATYTRSITASGYTFTPDTIAVTAAANFNATMTTVSVTAPANPSLCTVFGTLLAANGDPMADAEVEFALVKANMDGSGNLVVSDTYTATADVNGLIDVDLVRNDTFLYPNSHYLVTYAPMGWQKKRLVLAAATFDLTDLR